MLSFRLKILTSSQPLVDVIIGRCIHNAAADTSYLSVFSPNAGKYGLEKTPYLDNFHTVRTGVLGTSMMQVFCETS